MKNLTPIFSIFIIITVVTVAFQSLQNSPTAALKPLPIGDQVPAISINDASTKRD